MIRRVIIESPYAAPDADGVRLHVLYLRACLRDSLGRGEAPFASHGLYTQPGVLRDELPGERRLGIEAGLAWYRAAEGCVAYVDLGLSSGMRQGIARAEAAGLAVERRTLGPAALEGIRGAHARGEGGA